MEENIVHEPLRWAHEEGHTDCCYSEDGEFFITCGADGDIRIWNSNDPDDPSHVCIGEYALSAQHKGNKWYVATGSNDIQIVSYIVDQKKWDRDGVLGRYTAPVNQVTVSKNKNLVALAGEDMEVRLINLDAEDRKVTTFDGLQGPCLSVALCPNGTKIAASSGDGVLRIWDIESSDLVKEITCFPKVNSFQNAKNLCRIDFEPKKGNFLAYPNKNCIVLLNTIDWSENSLTFDQNEAEFSMIQFSPCGRYICSASIQGDFAIWDLATKKPIQITKHENKVAVTGLAWHPKGNNQIVYTDIKGEMSIMSNCIPKQKTGGSGEKTTSESRPEKDPPEIDEDGFFENEVDFSDVKFESDDDKDNENAISLEALKKDVMGDIEPELEDLKEGSSRSTTPRPRTPEVPLQGPFMPSSTPEHLDPRYLCWNDVGVVRSYGNNADDELSSRSIEVEFHDATFHSSLMINNYQEYFLGSLSKGALVVANANQVNIIPLQAHKKDWTLNFEESFGEEVNLVASSENLVCIATTNYLVRICSVFGIQRAVVAIPGPLVSMAAFRNTLAVAYHSGAVRTNDQCLNIKLFSFEGMTFESRDIGIALGPSSTLQWLGFSDCGTPCVMDSQGMISLYPNSVISWVPFCDTTKHRKSPADGFFVTSVFESCQTIAGIKCKGSMYPAFIPRPTVCELPLEPPFVEPSTEKTQMEMSLFTWSTLNVAGTEKKFKETAIKTFALACKNDLDQRAIEFMEMVANPQILTLALKYATRLDKKRMAEKLMELASRLKDENNENELPEVFQTPTQPSMIKLKSTSKNKSVKKSHSVENNTAENEKADNKTQHGDGHNADSQEQMFKNDSQLSDTSINSSSMNISRNCTPVNLFLKKSANKSTNPLSLTDSKAGINYDNPETKTGGEKRKLSDESPKEGPKEKQKKINRFLFSKKQ